MEAAYDESELATLGVAIRRAYVESPPPEVAERHIAAMLAEAERIAAAGAKRAVAPRRRSWRRPVFRLAAVVGASFLATAGLAVAGVRPPEPYSDFYEAVGFDVPGSDDPSEQQGSDRESPEPRRAPTSGDEASTTPQVGKAPAANDAGEDRPGRRQGQQPGHPSEEGQKTAEQARSGSTPPTDPGRSELHPAAPGVGPDADGPPGLSAESPGKSRAAATLDHAQGSSWSAALTGPPGRIRRSLGLRGGPPDHTLGTPAGGREKP